MAWIANVVQRVVGLGVGAAQLGIAVDELKSLPDARTYSLNQDLATATALARRGSQQGMTPQERAVAEQSIGTAQSRAQRAMEQRGLGNLAAAVTQVNTTEAFNRLEAQNQQIKRDYLGTYAQLGSKVQALENANVTSFNQQLAMQQQALGMAAQQGLASVVGSLGDTIGEIATKFDKDSLDQFKEQREAKKAEQAATNDFLTVNAPKTLMGDDSQFMQSIGTDGFSEMSVQDALGSSQGLSIGSIDPNTGYATSGTVGLGGQFDSSLGDYGLNISNYGVGGAALSGSAMDGFDYTSVTDFSTMTNPTTSN